MKFAVRIVVAAAACLFFSLSLFAATPTDTAKPKTAEKKALASAPNQKQLEQLTRALKQKNPTTAYARLSALAMQKSF
jgi:hypothetical protein